MCCTLFTVTRSLNAKKEHNCSAAFAKRAHTIINSCECECVITYIDWSYYFINFNFRQFSALITYTQSSSVSVSLSLSHQKQRTAHTRVSLFTYSGGVNRGTEKTSMATKKSETEQKMYTTATKHWIDSYSVSLLPHDNVWTNVRGTRYLQLHTTTKTLTLSLSHLVINKGEKSKEFESQFQIPNILNYLHKLSALRVCLFMYCARIDTKEFKRDELRMQFDKFSLISGAYLTAFSGRFVRICRRREKNSKNG